LWRHPSAVAANADVDPGPQTAARLWERVHESEVL
jgi:hypothetical protein